MKWYFPVFFSLSLLLSTGTKAQDVLPVYSDYLTDNLYLLFPSMAGASKRNKIRLTARQQWFDVKDSPSLQTLSIHGRIKNKMGVGGVIFNDRNGNFSTRGAYATFAYHILLSRSEKNLHQLSFGLSGGIIQNSIDLNSFSQFDPVFEQGDPSEFYGNFDISASYYYLEFFTHLSIKNTLTGKRKSYFIQDSNVNQRTYLLSSGYVFNNDHRPWSYEPSILFLWREETGEKSVDLNMKFYLDLNPNAFFGGISYRRSLGPGFKPASEGLNNQHLQYLTPFAGFRYRDFLFAYTYSRQMNQIVISNSGFHQITLGYNFGQNRSRYDCTCPAIR